MPSSLAARGCNTLVTPGLRRGFVSSVPGEYHVFRGARNRRREWETIPDAIDAALRHGYTPDAVPFEFARIIIHGSNIPYTGRGPNNEINVPISCILIGTPASDSWYVGPQIQANLIFTNAGIPPGTIPFVPNLAWTHSNFSILRPSASQPCVRYVTDLTSQFFALLLTNCMIISQFTAPTAPTMIVDNFSALFLFRCICFDFSGTEPMIVSNDAASLELFYCNIIAYKVFRSSGPGAIVPATLLVCYFCDFVVAPNFLGGLDSEVRLFEIESLGISKFFVSGCWFVYQAEVAPYTNDTRILDARTIPAPGLPISFLCNSYDTVATAAGTQLIYDAPNCTIDSGNFAKASGPLGTVGTVVPATII